MKGSGFIFIVFRLLSAWASMSALDRDLYPFASAVSDRTRSNSNDSGVDANRLLGDSLPSPTAVVRKATLAYR